MADLYGFQEHRDHRARVYRLLQAAALIELCRRDVGHPPQTIAELEGWASTRGDSGPVDPYAVLTDAQIDRVTRGA